MKLSKSQLRKKAEQTKKLIKSIVDGTINLPNNAIIFDPETLKELFTKRRLELVQYINTYKPQSIQELADLTKRKKQAVYRDLKALEIHELVSLKKVGKNVIPRIERKMAIIDLQEIYPLEMDKSAMHGKEIDAMVYVHNRNVNQLI